MSFSILVDSFPARPWPPEGKTYAEQRARRLGEKSNSSFQSLGLLKSDKYSIESYVSIARYVIIENSFHK